LRVLISEWQCIRSDALSLQHHLLLLLPPPLLLPLLLLLLLLLPACPR
jgi:hypothetical protein